MITEGRMQYLFDERGRRYLDVRPLQPAQPALPLCMLPRPPAMRRAGQRT